MHKSSNSCNFLVIKSTEVLNIDNNFSVLFFKNFRFLLVTQSQVLIVIALLLVSIIEKGNKNKGSFFPIQINRLLYSIHKSTGALLPEGTAPF